MFLAPQRCRRIFLENIRKYNSSFQMTSFGITNIVSNTGLPVFFVNKKIKYLHGFYSKCKDKFAIKSVLFFQHQIKVQSFCEFISQDTKKKKLINVAMSSTQQEVKSFQICDVHLAGIIIWLNYSKSPWMEYHQMIIKSL